MADNGFTVDPMALGSNAGPYADVAGQVAEVYQALTAALDAVEPCWGDDEAGSQFASNYLPTKRATLEQFAGISGAIDSAAGGITAWQYGYDSAEATLLDGLGTTGTG